MSPNDYTEDLLVERPAIRLFEDLGWKTVSAMEETFGSAKPSSQPSPGGRGSWLGRETKSEVVLVPRLRATLERLNPALPAEAIDSAVDELARDRSAMSLAAANEDIWHLLRNGVRVLVPDAERGGQKTERVRVVDWDNPQANDFLLVSQMTVTGDLYTCRPDLIGFVNGLPRLLSRQVALASGERPRKRGCQRSRKHVGSRRRELWLLHEHEELVSSRVGEGFGGEAGGIAAGCGLAPWLAD